MVTALETMKKTAGPEAWRPLKSFHARQRALCNIAPLTNGGESPLRLLNPNIRPHPHHPPCLGPKVTLPPSLLIPIRLWLSTVASSSPPHLPVTNPGSLPPCPIGVPNLWWANVPDSPMFSKLIRVFPAYASCPVLSAFSS